MLLLLFTGLLSIVIAFVMMVVVFALRASFLRICKQKDLGEASREDYFYFLKRKYFAKMFKLNLAIFGISILAYIAFVLPIFYVIVPFTFFNIIFAFNPDMSASDIIKLSFNLGTKKSLGNFFVRANKLILRSPNRKLGSPGKYLCLLVHNFWLLLHKKAEIADRR